MKVYDAVELKYEVLELAEKGIHTGCSGDVIAVNGDMCKVIFFAPKIYGDYAVVEVDEQALAFSYHLNDYRIKIVKEIVADLDENNHTRFLEVDVDEYDEIEVIVEKEKYAKEGVHKGMIGTVIMDYSIRNKWVVEFYDAEQEEDIAITEIHRDDFKIVKKWKDIYREEFNLDI